MIKMMMSRVVMGLVVLGGLGDAPAAFGASAGSESSCPKAVVSKLALPAKTESICLKHDQYVGKPAWLVLSLVPEAGAGEADENAGVTFSIVDAASQGGLLAQQSGFGEELLPIQVVREGKSRTTRFEVVEQPKLGWVALFRTTTPTSSLVVMKSYDRLTQKLISISPHQRKSGASSKRASEFFVAGLGDSVTLKVQASGMELSMEGAYSKRYRLQDQAWLLQD